MRVNISSDIYVENPSTDLLLWCQTNLRLKNPEYVKRAKLGLWLKNTPQFLYLYETAGNTIVLPFGTLRSILPYLDNASISTDFKNSHVDFDAHINLYDYQKKAVEEMHKSKFGILQSPTGSGKTQMGLALIIRLKQRALWLTHTKDLLEQSRSRAEQYIDKNLIGTITNGKINIGTGITFATIQTISTIDLSRYKYFWNTIIVDECHHVSGSPTTLTRYYKVLNHLAAVHKYGLSATVHRADGMIEATYALLGQVVHTVQTKTMDVVVQAIYTETKIDYACTNTDGTLNWAKFINYLVSNEERNFLLLKYILSQKKCSCLILSDRICHLKTLYEMLPYEIQKKSVVLTGKQSKIERQQAIDSMRSKEKMYMFSTYSLCKEGVDIPCLERLFLATPLSDYATITQSLGRISRRLDGKQKPVCYDFIDNNRYCFKVFAKREAVYKRNGYKVL